MSLVNSNIFRPPLKYQSKIQFDNKLNALIDYLTHQDMRILDHLL
jgi:hypothetical protein